MDFLGKLMEQIGRGRTLAAAGLGVTINGVTIPASSLRLVAAGNI